MNIKSTAIFLLSCFLLIPFSCQQQEIPTTNSITSTRNNKNVSQVVVDKKLTQLLPMEGLVYYKDEPFTGTSVVHYTKDQKAVAIQYVNGKKEGLYQKWYPDGLLSYEAHYVAGKQDGTSKTWWKNGKIRSESRFKEGVPHGEQWQWYKSGATFKRQLLVNGREEGLQQAWRENGKIYNNYEAKNGRIFGLKRANLCFELEEEVVQYKE